MPTAFAKNIRALRESKGLTQEELASKIQVERNTVVRWENGRVANPRQPEIIEKLKEFFDISDEDLFGYNDGFHAKNKGSCTSPKNVERAMSTGVRMVRVCTPGAAKMESPDELWSFTHETKLYEELAEKHPNCFALQMNDKCTNLNFTDRDVIFVDPDLQPVDGSIAVVSIDGSEALVRRVLIGDDSIRLVAETTEVGQQEDLDIRDAGHEVRFFGTVFWWQSSKEGE